MSARFNIALTFGVLAVMLLTSVTIIYFTKLGVDQSKRNNVDIQTLNASFHHFVDMWTERIKIGNTNTNNTQDLIVETQQNILGNLTGHRYVTNQTFNQIQQVLNQTATLTSEQYNEQAEGKVKSILGNMSKEHDIIFKALNISKSDNHTDAEQDIAQLKEALEALENRTSQD